MITDRQVIDRQRVLNCLSKSKLLILSEYVNKTEKIGGT